jgi:hypothetical protein
VNSYVFYVGEIDITTFFKLVGAWCIYWFHINPGLINVVKSYVAIVLEKASLKDGDRDLLEYCTCQYIQRNESKKFTSSNESSGFSQGLRT